MTSVETQTTKQSPLGPLLVSLTTAQLRRRLGFAVGVYALCATVFWAFAVWQGADPGSLFSTMWTFSIGSDYSIQQTLVRAVPIALAALACTIPARAGMVNIGGEGQIIMGAIAAVGVSFYVGDRLEGLVGWLVMAVAGTLAGAVWAGICGWLRIQFNASESVTTLFFNFIANGIMLYLIFGSWRNTTASGVPESQVLTDGQVLPIISGTTMHLGVPLIVVAAAAVWWGLNRTGWGFRIRVVGGNMEAAYRFGIHVKSTMLTAFASGGALAGLAGALVVMGVEGALRPGMTATFGFIAFLANFAGGSRPFAVLATSVLFSAIALSGNGLQLVEGLDGNASTVLLSLIVFSTLVISGRQKGAFE